MVLVNMNNTETFKILTLDGGGTRGIYSAQLLALVEQELDAPIKESFDLIAGTSTGAIIAGAIAADISMDEIVSLFETESPDIFKKKWYRNLLFSSKYSEDVFAQVIAKHIPAKPLSDISTPLIITSSEITTSERYLFRSNYAETVRDSEYSDGDVCIRDAVVASCSAPTFFAPKGINNLLFADGGLWANNPSIAAYTEALTVFGKDVSQVKILSVGTGHAPNMYRKKRRWGFLLGWGGPKLVSFVMMLQAQASAKMVKQLLKDNYMRICPSIDFWDIDSAKPLKKLKSMAARDFENLSAEIKVFLNIL